MNGFNTRRLNVYYVGFNSVLRHKAQKRWESCDNPGGTNKVFYIINFFWEGIFSGMNRDSNG